MEIKRPLLLISNDDGYQAKCIRQLVEMVSDYGDIIVCAPEDARSGFSCAFSATTPLRLYLREKREGHGGDILHAAFEGDTHRSTVMGIDGGVVAVIDAAYNHIRPPWTDFCQGHLHTIDGRAVA